MQDAISVSVKRPVSYIEALQRNKNRKKYRDDQQQSSSGVAADGEMGSSSGDGRAKRGGQDGQFGVASSSEGISKGQDVNMD